MRKKPMLAQPVGAFERITDEEWHDGLYIQPKLDGVRCLIQYENKPLKNIDDLSGQLTENVVVAYSRTGKEWKNIDHILEELIPFFEKYPNVILDGELYNHDFKNDFEKIISMVRKTKPSAWDRVESKLCVQFHCYDIIDEKLPYLQRKEFINQSLMLLGNSVHTLDTYRVRDTEAVEVNHEEFLELGYEGSILRKNTPYECKRSWTLMKVKDFSDAEALIVGYEEGKGKREGTLGKFLMQDEDGNKFGCPPGKGYNYQDMRDILNNIHKYMGQTATFTYFERTKAGSYRHPLFKGLRNYE